MISSLTSQKAFLWGAGCGCSQLSFTLSKIFSNVIATDISKQEIESAIKVENITFKEEHSEKISIETNSIDVLTVAQAIHWSNFERFYSEVPRV